MLERVLESEVMDSEAEAADYDAMDHSHVNQVFVADLITVHHIPAPAAVFGEMVRVVKSGGLLFVRDLLRPNDETTLRGFVQKYAGEGNAHQQQMFADSLHAALSLEEVRALVTPLGFDASTVQPTTDRHWTWTATKARESSQIR